MRLLQNVQKKENEMITDRFINDYVYYLKLHEEHRWSTERRNEFWRWYMEEKKYEDQ